MKLHRYHEADQTLKNGPNFDIEECIKFFGPIGYAGLLVIQAQVDMAAGRLVNIHALEKCIQSSMPITKIRTEIKYIISIGLLLTNKCLT